MPTTPGPALGSVPGNPSMSFRRNTSAPERPFTSRAALITSEEFP
jgi:hypothetical protein